MSTLNTEMSILLVKDIKDFSKFKLRNNKFCYFDTTKRNAHKNLITFVSIDFEPSNKLFVKLPDKEIVFFVELCKFLNPEYSVTLGRTGYTNDDFVFNLFTVELLIKLK